MPVKSRFAQLLDGECSPADSVSWLTEMAHRGETVDEIVDAVTEMRGRMLRVRLPKVAIDLCGTGGFPGSRFNVSTATAFFLAGIGIPVAKHGNRGSRSHNGSFDFLEALGISIDLGSEKIGAIFEKTDLCFLFARIFHPAVGRLAPVRQQVPGRTIFNLIGPLCNPAAVPLQIIGTTSESQGKKLAEASKRLGTDRTIILVAEDGRDEIISNGVTHVFEVTPRRIISYSVDGREWCDGVGYIDGGDAVANSKVFESWLENTASHPGLSSLIALNAGVALYLVGDAATFSEGYEKALSLTSSTRTLQTVNRYRELSQL